MHDHRAADDRLRAEEGQVGVVEDAAHVGLLLEEAVLAAQVADLVLVGRPQGGLGALAGVPLVGVEVPPDGVARARELQLVLRSYFTFEKWSLLVYIVIWRPPQPMRPNKKSEYSTKRTVGYTGGAVGHAASSKYCDGFS